MNDFAIRYRSESFFERTDRLASRMVRAIHAVCAPIAGEAKVDGFVILDREYYEKEMGGGPESTFTFEVEQNGKTYRFVGVRPDFSVDDRVSFRFRGEA